LIVIIIQAFIYLRKFLRL